MAKKNYHDLCEELRSERAKSSKLSKELAAEKKKSQKLEDDLLKKKKNLQRSELVEKLLRDISTTN